LSHNRLDWQTATTAEQLHLTIFEAQHDRAGSVANVHARREGDDVMGMMLEMNCPCGYSADITLGGNRRNHMDVCMFPHLCKQCGVVNVSIYADMPCCPKCSSTQVIMYGEIERTKAFNVFGIRLRSLDRKYWEYDERVSAPLGDSYETWSNLRLSHGNHFCPSCSQMQLRVSQDAICFFD
jgi:predicted Zn-ribbon and HTH transcriptional regulator